MLNPNFTASQTLGNGAIINLQDTSTGSDVLVVSRNVYITTASGTYLVPAGNASPTAIIWAIINTSISLNVLSTDTACYIQVDWVDVSNVARYTVKQLYCFTNFGETFLYSLTQSQAAQPSLLLDTNYLSNKFLVRVYIDSANNAVAYGGDISASSNCIDIYTYIISNQSFFF